LNRGVATFSGAAEQLSSEVCCKVTPQNSIFNYPGAAEQPLSDVCRKDTSRYDTDAGTMHFPFFLKGYEKVCEINTHEIFDHWRDG